MSSTLVINYGAKIAVRNLTSSKLELQLVAVRGDKGVKGDKGDKGDTGQSAYQASGYAGTLTQWIASLKGETGASAYSAAVAGGFVGTQAQWIAALKGDKGDRGDKGTAGDQVELRKGATFIEWRYTNGNWANLIAIADLKGDQGEQGIQGFQGNPGRDDGLAYTWNTAIAAADPGVGKIALNNAALASATILYISETDADGRAVAPILATWDDSTNTIKGSLVITKAGDPTTFAAYNITSNITDSGTYDRYTIAHVASAGSFAADDKLVLTFGRAGNVGATGAAGSVTGVNFGYVNTITDLDPGNGKFKMNSLTLSAVTQIYLDNVEAAAVDVTAWIDSFDDFDTPIKGHLVFRGITTATVFAVYAVTGPVVDGTGYRKIPVSFVAGGGTFANNANFSLGFTAFGAKGETGEQGEQGEQGLQGVQGPAGSLATADRTKLDGILPNADVTNATNVGSSIAGVAVKAAPVDADQLPLIDSAASSALKKFTWVNLKATLKTYFDTLYAAAAHTHTFASLTSKPTTVVGYGITDAYTKTEADTLLAGKQTTIAYTPENVALKGATNGYASLDSSGKIPTSQLPALAITDTFVAANQAAMLAATAQVGDVVVRTDLSKSYILKTEPATTLANWQELLTPGAPVLSVNGKTGAVTIGWADIADRPTLGTASAANSTAFASAAQGAKADTAVQPGALGTAAAQNVGVFATAAQGTKADGALQASLLASVADVRAWTATKIPEAKTLKDAAAFQPVPAATNWSPDLSTGPNWIWTLTGTSTLGLPTGVFSGQEFRVVIKQPASGSPFAMTWPTSAKVKFTGSAAPTLSTALGAVDMLLGTVEDATPGAEIIRVTLIKGWTS